MTTINYKITLLSVLCSLFSVLSFSQNYEWQWAKSGGGVNKYQGEPQGSLNFYNEMIWDIAIDADNNYYFLASLATGSTHVDGNLVTDYAESFSTAMNTVIFSFTCDGTYRWSRPVGGGAADAQAYHLTLDNDGGIYLMFEVMNLATENNSGVPVHFSEDDVRPYWSGTLEEQEALKSMFLLKYDTDNGDFIWSKDIQGNVGSNNWFLTTVGGVEIDSNNVLHVVVALDQGVHLDGMITVPEYAEGFGLHKDYYLLKFNHITGDLIGTPLLLPMEGGGFSRDFSFRYDEALNRYYIAGSKTYFSSSGIDVSFNDVTFGEQNTGFSYCFLISFNPNDLDDWWYKEIVVSDGGHNASDILDIEIDSNSDIYVVGNYLNPNYDSYNVSFGDHTFSDSYHGNIPFILKMNAQGQVQWSKIPDSQGGGGTINSIFKIFDVAINGDEVAIASSAGNVVWGNFSMTRPFNHGFDPVAVRFDKQTGEPIGLHDIMGYQGGEYYLTAVTADNDGNYVVGGAMRAMLFTDNPNGIATLYNNTSYTDFFFARLANSACGSAATESFEKQTLKLYPNPTSGLVYIEAENLQSYEVYNLLGQKLLSGNSEVINLQDLSKGTYIVKVRTQSGEVMTSKIIKH